MWHLRSDMSIAYDVVHVLVNVFAPNRLGVHSLTRPAQECLRGRHLTLILTTLRRTLEFLLILLLHRDSLISTHSISETKRLSFSYSSSVYLERFETYEKKNSTHMHTSKFLTFFSQKQISYFYLYKSSAAGLASGMRRGSKGLL